MSRELLSALDRGVRALSIQQPWCHHILHDGKDIENRSWGHSYRGWFLLHAGKRTDGRLPAKLADVPRGGIVGAAKIVDCVRWSESRWFVGHYGFVLTDPIEIPLVPCNGALGFFSVDADTLAAVRAHVEAIAP